MKKIVIFLAITALCSCGNMGVKDFYIVAGSESQEVEHLITDFGQKNGVTFHIDYKGSLEIMGELENENTLYDAVFPANSIWLRMGDKKLRRVKGDKSIMRSPVVLGIKKKKAQELGWIDAPVSFSDILAEVEKGNLEFAMTSATQSNSGASAYLGMLYALAGQPDVLTSKELNSIELEERMKKLLRGMNRSSGSSGWLKDLYLEKYNFLDGMFNYEVMIIAANKELVRQGKDPLYVIYPSDGLTVADCTLGYINKGDENKEALYNKLIEHLESDLSSGEIWKTGFRTGLLGMSASAADQLTFNEDWGIDLKKVISPIPWPETDVVYEALILYQTLFRKPSFTVFALDFSGSMEGEGINSLKEAMITLLDQQIASEYLLQASKRDINVILPFNNDLIWPDAVKVEGNDSAGFNELLGKIKSLNAGGGTDIYRPVMKGLEIFGENSEILNNYLPAVILMTDGKSDTKYNTFRNLQEYWETMDVSFDIPPVFGITFGNASDEQLIEITGFTSGRVFDGRKDLVKAFKQAKGYN